MIQEQSSSQHHNYQLPKYGGAGSATGVARASKKNKPKKIPQRGLGVAQLEKLRLEEQKKMEGGGGAGGVSALPPAAHSRALSGGRGHLLPLHHPPPPVPLSGFPRPPADGGVRCGFSPVLWDPADPTKLQFKIMPPLPMVSTGLSLAASSSHPTEPPSNQMYSSSGSRSSAAPAPAEEDRDPAGVDRSWPFMFEGMTAAVAFGTSTGKATPTVPFAAGRMVTREAAFADVRPDQSRREFRATNYFSSTSANYTDWSPDFAYCKNGKATGSPGEPAFLSLSARPTLVIPSAHLPGYSDLGIVPSQVSISASPSPRPFYSFLPAGPVRHERPLSECRADASDGVDLELKL